MDKYEAWLASPFGQVHRDAEQSKQKKTACASSWHKNPFKILDHDDILYPDGMMRKHSKILARAADVFRSDWNMRKKVSQDPDDVKSPLFGADVERDTIMRILEQSLGNFNRRNLTSSQQQTLVLEREARERGLPISKHIATSLGISVRAAEMRIATARPKAKTFGNKPIIGIMELERKVKKELSRTCCWCEKPTPNGLRALCDDCETRFFYLENYPPSLTPDRLQKLISKSNASHWEKAKEAA